LRKAIGILVPKRMVEETLRILRKAQLVDSSLEFSRTQDLVAIPLLHEPSDQEAVMLSRSLRTADFQQILFAERKTEFRDLQETVRGRVPVNLYSSLPRSFDVIGDIVVVDLPEELQSIASTVGHAILELYPQLRLVLRKSSRVSGIFRTRTFQVIAGSGSTETIYREFGCAFRLDVAAVYFNPRLSHERMRVAKQVERSEILVDMFAGVGPYSVLTAKLQPEARVYSVDINPTALKYLNENVFLNGVADRVIPILGDARELAATSLRGAASRVVMNLPSEAQRFLSAAAQVLKAQGGIIHYYTFASRNESVTTVEDEIQSEIERQGRKVEAFTYGKMIKEVAPNRVQFAVDALVK